MLLCSRPAWAQTYKVIYAFDAQQKLVAGDTIVRDKAGDFYGWSWDSQRMCASGPCGAVYRISSTGKETTLYEFKGRPDGYRPIGGLALDTHGMLYGTTYEGGNSTFQGCGGVGCGTVFSLTTSGHETVIHSFDGPPGDGMQPEGGIVVYPNGALYGTTPLGGNGPDINGLPGDGTLYQIAPDNHRLTILHDFSHGYDGGLPSAGLLLVGSSLYGTAQFGGIGPCQTTFGSGCGTVFKYDENGLTTLYEFHGADGDSPAGTLIIDIAGNLYGTTVLGGDPTNCPGGGGLPPGCGAVFKVAPSGQETVLHAFTGLTDGSWPSSALVMDSAGNLYGTAYFGGDWKCSCGTIFRVDASGDFSVIHTFHGTDGANPMAILASDGKFYGVTNNGGPANHGVVYEFKP